MADSFGTVYPLATFRRWLVLPGLFMLIVSLLPPGSFFSAVQAAPPAYDDDSRVLFGSNDGTRAVAVGDMNGDGTLDIIVGNDGNNALQGIYLNSGGVFSQGAPDRIFTGLGRDPSDLVVGDFNADAQLDVLVADKSQATQLFLNDGNANLTAGFSFGSAAVSIAAGDVNGDGNLDVVVSGSPAKLYVNSGSGAFTFSRNLNNEINSVAIGDVNGDGWLDIVAGTMRAQVYLYLNAGNGTFPSGTLFGTADPLTVTPCSSCGNLDLALGDLNADGILDIAAGNAEAARIYLSTSGTALSFAQTIIDSARGSFSWTVAIGDMNSDGALDLVVGRGYDWENIVYLNNGSGAFPLDVNSALPFGTSIDSTRSIALADMNGDSALDIVVGNDFSGGSDSQNAVYVSDQAGEFALHTTRRFGIDFNGGRARPLSDLAAGDVDGDGALDLVTHFRGTSEDVNVIYLNDGSGGYPSLETGTINCTLATIRCFGSGNDAVLALADLNGDQALDIVTYNGGSTTLYFNDGAGNFDWPGATSSFQSGSDGDFTRQIAVGDMNEDEHLDLVLGNRVHLNDGTGNFDWPGAERIFAEKTAWAVAVGDLNNDGYADIVTGYESVSGSIFFNDGSGNFDWPGAEQIYEDSNADLKGLALADVNNDGALDILNAVFNGRDQIYLNDGRGNFDWPDARQLFGASDDAGRRIRAVDLNGDTYLDIVVANQNQTDVIYLNNGMGNFAWAGAEHRLGTAVTRSEALTIADVNRDAAPDVVIGKRTSPGDTADGHVVHLNSFIAASRLPNQLPAATVLRPVPTQEADFISSPAIVSNDQINVRFRLADSEGDPVRFVRAYFSPNGGGQWFPAIQPAGSNQAGPWPTNCADGCEHTFTWDTYRSGFFGKSDNVIFRIEAYPGHRTAARAIPPLNQRPYVAATSFPFRVRGTQVQVRNEAGQPYPAAIVYRLPAGETRGAAFFPPRQAGQAPLTTDAQGFLRGRGELTVAQNGSAGDRLLAMAVVSATETYTIYHTSAAPTAAGLDLAQVASPGVQTLQIRTDQPLMLFNLDVSLEWDARSDPDYLSRLRADFRRSSEFLFDWSDGQIALGDIRIYQDREGWEHAHIRIYASNVLRPNAVRGGIVPEESARPDPDRPEIRYTAGQVRMGATWNRYGEAGANLGEDWPRTLAHEIGHFALYLDDNYLGLDDNFSLITVDGCRGAMADPYREDYSEFHPPGAEWDAQCEQTLSARTTSTAARPAGRADWQSLRLFYEDPPAGIRFNQPESFNAQPGPAVLPLAVTTVTLIEPSVSNTTLAAPIFITVDPNGARISPERGARAFLFQGDRLIDLGSPPTDQILARGARPGDRLCVYDPAAQRLGCRQVSATDQRITLNPAPDLRPDIRITPVQSTTLDLEVHGLAEGVDLRARLYPGATLAEAPIALSWDANAKVYRGQAISSPDSPAFDGRIHLTIAETAGGAISYETVVDFALGGNPGRRWASRAPRGNPGRRWASRAPVVSNDGEAILYDPGISLEEGQFFALQATSILPPPPLYATPLDRAYRLTATPGVDFQGTSLSIAYRGEDVPQVFENGVNLYYWNGSTWQRLDETRRDAERNEVAASIPGPGLYALMVSVSTSLEGPAWNTVPFSGAGGPLPAILESIDGAYRLVYWYDSNDATDPWKLYAPGAPGWVNDLTELQTGRDYWIYATRNISLLTRTEQGDTSLQAHSSVPADTSRFPPATFYGIVNNGEGYVAAAGQEVVAYVNGIACGRATTVQVGAEVGYSVAVESVSPSVSGCGAADRTVVFTVAGQSMAVREPWDNTVLAERNLTPGEPPPEGRVYLPAIHR